MFHIPNRLRVFHSVKWNRTETGMLERNGIRRQSHSLLRYLGEQGTVRLDGTFARQLANRRHISQFSCIRMSPAVSISENVSAYRSKSYRKRVQKDGPKSRGLNRQFHSSEAWQRRSIRIQQGLQSERTGSGRQRKDARQAGGVAVWMDELRELVSPVG